ncbi:NAD(P)H-dependent glycerol-3-phosphate dehydrogenase [Desulfosediminicola ganghwensis]|uniref:NAD(P)H-dependent glycerol-3-phosphate dehydrogenase n=1 Tax=Desulfosediminicola ganghwensis TaxID=2569540 RepID=UPI0010AC8EA6|nr:NAD(P)H-dependent glycerol-3-phosphate dehydrogenase [Desulfosediminicola ganghwensis]
MKSKPVAVIGAGSWGTALAMVLSSKGHTVRLWGHNPEHILDIQKERENKKYLPGFPLPETLQAVDDLESCLEDCKVVVMVVPSHGFRAVYEHVVPLLQQGTCVVSAVKGIENSTLMTMTQVMDDVHKSFADKNIETAVLSGPSFAKEVAANMPTAITIGCKSIGTAKMLQQLFVTESFRVYASTDVIGLEISAALKNIVAVAAGICDGLGYGLNTRAALITRGLAEITRLGVAMKAEAATFSGLSGLGDLVLTCTGDLSRNRSVGLKLGQGRKLDDIVNEMNMVAEGVKTTKSCYHLARRLGIEMPILEQVYAILYEQKNCSDAVRDLLSRELKVE